MKARLKEAYGSGSVDFIATTARHKRSAAELRERAQAERTRIVDCHQGRVRVNSGVRLTSAALPTDGHPTEPDKDLLRIFDDLDEYILNENCQCQALCTCDE